MTSAIQRHSGLVSITVAPKRKAQPVLPRILYLRIFSYLPASDLARSASGVSRSWCEISRDPKLPLLIQTLAHGKLNIVQTWVHRDSIKPLRFGFCTDRHLGILSRPDVPESCPSLIDLKEAAELASIPRNSRILHVEGEVAFIIHEIKNPLMDVGELRNGFEEELLLFHIKDGKELRRLNLKKGYGNDQTLAIIPCEENRVITMSRTGTLIRWDISGNVAVELAKGYSDLTFVKDAWKFGDYIFTQDDRDRTFGYDCATFTRKIEFPTDTFYYHHANCLYGVQKGDKNYALLKVYGVDNEGKPKVQWEQLLSVPSHCQTREWFRRTIATNGKEIIVATHESNESNGIDASIFDLQTGAKQHTYYAEGTPSDRIGVLFKERLAVLTTSEVTYAHHKYGPDQDDHYAMPQFGRSMAIYFIHRPTNVSFSTRIDAAKLFLPNDIKLGLSCTDKSLCDIELLRDRILLLTRYDEYFGADMGRGGYSLTSFQLKEEQVKYYSRLQVTQKPVAQPEKGQQKAVNVCCVIM